MTKRLNWLDFLKAGMHVDFFNAKERALKEKMENHSDHDLQEREDEKKEKVTYGR